MNTFIALLISGFFGFALGRFGDKYFGYLEKLWIIPIPHHWLLGAFFTVLGLFWQTYLSSFGIALFISDLNDFLHLRFFGPEPPHTWRFWSIN